MLEAMPNGLRSEINTNWRLMKWHLAAAECITPLKTDCFPFSLLPHWIDLNMRRGEKITRFVALALLMAMTFVVAACSSPYRVHKKPAEKHKAPMTIMYFKRSSCGCN
jgi:hypothetical protein